jgi:hypothetical protein
VSAVTKKITSHVILAGFVVILLIAFIPKVKAERISEIISGRPELAGPPWYDEAWHYRKPLTITNNGASLPWYQVLIRLDANNFNFNRAQSDGSDIRFTHSDGTTALNYWIESWDNANYLAYVWVRVPGVATGYTSIYLYYGNPEANTASSGIGTFDSFEDDWDQFRMDKENQAQSTERQNLDREIFTPFSWTIISGTPEATLGILSLTDGEGIKSKSTYLFNAIGMRAKFGLGNGYEWGGFINGDSGQRTMVGDIDTDPTNLFLLDYRNGLDSVLFPRVGGEDWHGNFHVFEVRWDATQSIGDINHGQSNAISTQPNQVPNASLPVTLYSAMDSNATLQVDWVYVRQYRDPEPTVTVGSEQGLVALSITNSDSPDPIQRYKSLTYLITISNSSQINAPGVVVTDTLPASVDVGPIDTSQGTCEGGSIVYCDLNTVNAGSQAWITIVVTPTMDGLISNVASVGSPGYELDLSDNTAIQDTLVDTVPPIVNWEEPVQNGGTYFSSGGFVTLEASAIDNYQVAWVEYKYWDHVSEPNHWVIIGRDYTYPYQAQFDTSLLVPNQAYQTFAYAADLAGNQSNPNNQRIFIGRRSMAYLPLIQR